MTQQPHNPEHGQLVDAVKDALRAHDADPARLDAMRAHIAATPVRGATTLREGHSTRAVWAVGVVLAAAAVLLMVFIQPVVDRRTTVSAAEILGRSRAALAAQGNGVEVLTYDLTLDGALSDLLPAEQGGRLTVEETIDHEHAGRYRLLKIAPDGSIVGAIADDPVRGTRVRYLRADGRGYLLRFSDADVAKFSFVTIKRVALQGFITLMQAQSTEAVQTVQRDGEPCYEITVAERRDTVSPFLSLSKARAVITAADSRLVEFSAAGLIADRPFGIEFALKQRELRPAPSVSDSDFDIAPRPGDIVLHGNASSNPVWDIVERALAAIPQQPQK